MTLKGRSAIVTGSTSGIGLGIARALAAQGANIMLNGFGEAAAIEALRKEIAAGGVKVAYSAADLTKPEAVAGLAFDQYWLQPMDGPAAVENTAAAVRYCLDHPQWRLSLQTHKLIGIP